jgi:hypothetical protein
MTDHIRDDVMVEPDVDGVETRPERNSVVELEMTMTVQSKTAHGRTLGYAERIECSSEPKERSAMSTHVRRSTPARVADTTSWNAQGGRSLEDHRNRAERPA